MRKRTGPYGEYRKRRTGWCVWCGECFDTNHRNARTCGAYCRLNLARFRKLTGFEPEEAVGRITAQAAYTELVAKLLDDERRRRELVKAVATGGAAAMFEVAKQQAEATKLPKRA